MPSRPGPEPSRSPRPVAGLAALAACAAVPGCAPPDASAPAGPGRAVQEAEAVALEYTDGYYAQFPEEAYETGYPDIPWDRLGDRSAEALARWEAREDAWLERLDSIDPGRLEGTPAAVAYGVTLERLRSARERRACRTELWNVSPTWTGWQSILPATFAQQPVGDPAARDAALARLRDVARYVDTETANLRRGLEQGFTAPATNVDAVLAQLETLLDASPVDSPFHDPAARDGDADFADAVRAAIVDTVRPAIRRHRDFLRDEYRPRARTDPAVTADPGDLGCYQASVRFWSTLTMDPRQIHEAGLAEMERIRGAMADIARRSFGTSDVDAVLERVRTEPRYTFESEEAVLAYARAAVERAEAAVPAWFGTVPDAEVVVRPFPAFQRASGGGFYSAGAADGSRPGVYELGTYQPTTISRAGMEATAFHETWPGHHLQVSIALMNEDAHPVTRYFFSSGMGEGWALYTERLADEMGLYSGDVDRLGMLSNEALRAARLVVDPGIHVLGWSRQQAIDYMLANTAESEAAATAQIDRYIAVPGQATSYLLGSLEIQRLRADAEERLGERFDVRAFHDVVLADGTVTLPMLRAKIEGWIQARAAAGG